MAQRRKKKGTQGVGAQKISSETPGKSRLKPLVRTMLLSDLVFLAAVQWLYDLDMVLPMAADVATAGGSLVLAAALYIQFRTPKGKGLRK